MNRSNRSRSTRLDEGDVDPELLDLLGKCLTDPLQPPLGGVIDANARERRDAPIDDT